MRYSTTPLRSGRGPARRLAAFAAGLLGVGLLLSCSQTPPPAAVGPPRIYEVVSQPSDTLYTGYLQASIPSLGTYAGGRRVPDLLLTVRYRQDPKTGDLVKGVIRFLVQPDGPVTADLALPDSALLTNVTHQVCNFRVNVDAVFGAALPNTDGVSVGGVPDEEEDAPGSAAAGGASNQARGPRTVIHATRASWGRSTCGNADSTRWGKPRRARTFTGFPPPSKH